MFDPAKESIFSCESRVSSPKAVSKPDIKDNFCMS